MGKLRSEVKRSLEMLGIVTEQPSRGHRKKLLKWFKRVICQWIHTRQRIDRKWLLIFRKKKRKGWTWAVEENYQSFEKSERAVNTNRVMLLQLLKITDKKNKRFRMEKSGSKWIKLGHHNVRLRKTKKEKGRKLSKHELQFAVLLRRHTTDLKKWKLKHKFKDKRIKEWFPSNQVTCLWSPKLKRKRHGQDVQERSRTRLGYEKVNLMSEPKQSMYFWFRDIISCLYQKDIRSTC